MIQFNCKQCNKRYIVDPKFAGKTIRCKACSAALLIPPSVSGRSEHAPEAGPRRAPAAPAVSKIPKASNRKFAINNLNVEGKTKSFNHNIEFPNLEAPKKFPHGIDASAAKTLLAKYQITMDRLCSIFFWILILSLIGLAGNILLSPSFASLPFAIGGAAIHATLTYFLFQTRSWVNYGVALYTGQGLIANIGLAIYLAATGSMKNIPFEFLLVAGLIVFGLILIAQVWPFLLSVSNIRVLQKLDAIGIDPRSSTLSKSFGPLGKIFFLLAFLALIGAIPARGILVYYNRGRAKNAAQNSNLLSLLKTAIPDRGGKPSTGRTKPADSKEQPVSPELGEGKIIAEGIEWHEVTIAVQSKPMRLWIYLPERGPDDKLPCILIAPAGSSLLCGMKLGEGDRPEHLPYVKAGFAVVSYEISGALDPEASAQGMITAIKDFMAVEGGIQNARTAIDFILKKMPFVDQRLIFTAGHSSAATLSLQVAQHDERISGCIAYAPVTNLDMFSDFRKNVATFSRYVPGLQEFVNRYSPHRLTNKLVVPLFIFHSVEDQVVSVRHSEDFAQTVSRHNPRVEFVKAVSGDHYHSMMEAGVPGAILWLKQQIEKKTGSSQK